MIGCLILGTCFALGAARMIGRRHGFCRSYGGGGFGDHCGGGRMRGLHRHGWGGWGGGGGFGRGGYGGGYDDDGHSHEFQGGPFGHDHGSPWEPEGGRRSGRLGDFILNSILGRVRATATQEGTIRQAVDQFHDDMKNVGEGEAKKTRQDVGSALRKSQFDEVFMGELFARQDTAIEKTRKAFVGLMSRVHDVLDEEQRGRLADMVEKGPRFWPRRFDW